MEAMSKQFLEFAKEYKTLKTEFDKIIVTVDGLNKNPVKTVPSEPAYNGVGMKFDAEPMMKRVSEVEDYLKQYKEFNKTFSTNITSSQMDVWTEIKNIKDSISTFSISRRSGGDRTINKDRNRGTSMPKDLKPRSSREKDGDQLININKAKDEMTFPDKIEKKTVKSSSQTNLNNNMPQPGKSHIQQSQTMRPVGSTSMGTHAKNNPSPHTRNNPYNTSMVERERDPKVAYMKSDDNLDSYDGFKDKTNPNDNVSNELEKGFESQSPFDEEKTPQREKKNLNYFNSQQEINQLEKVINRLEKVDNSSGNTPT